MSGKREGERDSFVLLQVGNRRFALPANIVVELAPPVRLHHFPHRTALLAGVIVRRGHIVPVYDAGPVLIGRESPMHRFYLVAQREFGNTSEPSAIPVNGECEMATGDLEPRDADDPEFVIGKLTAGEERLDVLDLNLLAAARPPEPAHVHADAVQV
ncbi:MAG: chemotaxis protein CheW, partial [Candidatus Acidiferrales bacterium]